MQAIILAAGMGKRLKELTKDNTKCMVRVNGVSLIERMLRQLDALNLQRIILVVGYEGQKLKDYVDTLSVHTSIEYVNNPIYDKTNNIYSLYLAKDYLMRDNTLLLESDLIFEDELLQMLIDDSRDTLALVDRYESWMDGTCVEISESDDIEAFVPKNKFNFDRIKYYYKTVNIYKFSKNFSQKYYVPFLEAYSSALGNNEYYEQVLRVITMLDDPQIKAKRLNGQKWYEIDDVQDLDIAESIFTESDEECLSRIQSRFGGYWRYPHMLDFCYLVNPFFPTKRLSDEIKANFEKLLTQYPSGQNVNSLLASKYFSVAQDCIVVGNGAAELIKALLEKCTGKIGFIRPTFEEYPNRLEIDKRVFFEPSNCDYSYNATDLIEFFEDKGVESIVLVNPDNPSGNLVPKGDVLALADWCRAKKIRLILDESFIDFADGDDNSLLTQNVLQSYPGLIVIKSISKSYGVPGVRLGILASSDRQLISALKKEVAIWNINSFGEFFLQVIEKYHSDYREALKKFRAVRIDFQEALSRIPGLRVVTSQASYFLVEITNGMSAHEITAKLLAKNGIFIKDLSSKAGFSGREYVRISIRSEEENRRLCNALEVIFMANSSKSHIEGS